jgi:hypothetical protein
VPMLVVIRQYLPSKLEATGRLDRVSIVIAHHTFTALLVQC